MSEDRPPRRILRGIGAVLTGVLAIVVLSIGTDVLMHATGVFPELGQPMSDSLLLLATAYRTAYGVAGSYLAARLAPDRPMRYAMMLGFIGLAVSTLGAAVTWNQGPAVGHAWYPLALVALALPSSWLGGRLRLLQSGRRVTPSGIAEERQALRSPRRTAPAVGSSCSWDLASPSWAWSLMWFNSPSNA